MQMTLFNVSSFIDPHLPMSRKLDIYREYRAKVIAIAGHIQMAKRARAQSIWREAFDAPMPFANCVHNAAIDDNLQGWCQTRAQLRAAKQCKKLIEDWTAHHIADRACDKLWRKLMPTSN